MRREFLFGVQKINAETRCREFNQTPFVQSPLKWMTSNRVFRKNGIEFKLGDFIKRPDDHDTYLWCITSLSYQPGDWQRGNHNTPGYHNGKKHWPVLFVHARRFDQNPENPHEIYARSFARSFSAADDFRLVKVIVGAAAMSAGADCTVCKLQMNDDGTEFSQYIHPRTMYSFKHLTTGGAWVWIEIFIDAFRSKTSRRYSTLAVYVTWSNVRSEYRGHREFVKTLMLLPPGVNFTEAAVLLRKDLQQLYSTGVTAYDAVKKHHVLIKGAVSVLPADLVQVSYVPAFIHCISFISFSRLYALTRLCALAHIYSLTPCACQLLLHAFTRLHSNTLSRVHTYI
jgi:hypothetical protein